MLLWPRSSAQPEQLPRLFRAKVARGAAHAIDARYYAASAVTLRRYALIRCAIRVLFDYATKTRVARERSREAMARRDFRHTPLFCYAYGR